jgi:U3 small nucleolar RNA-associated protein 20
VLQHFPDEEEITFEPSREDKPSSLQWLIHKMCREARYEAAKKAKTPTKVYSTILISIPAPFLAFQRSCVLKWMAALSIELGVEQLPKYLLLILPIIIREFTVTNHAIGKPPQPQNCFDYSTLVTEELKTLSGEVLDLIKKTVGVEIFTRKYAAANQHLLKQRAEKKKRRALEV